MIEEIACALNVDQRLEANLRTKITIFFQKSKEKRNASFEIEKNWPELI